MELTQQAQTASRELLGWLRIEFAIEKPSQRLIDYANSGRLHEICGDLRCEHESPRHLR
ncbi:hypothetical protein U5801_12405 [Lamprobacter modestohalophilus]|uniref:hypothetical protein n=1 Tax=Lamprobacter modestohalophilus TaxID=1064514 RepID=UPI002ADEAB85|nr:hypothetical protein [Lamprobacter modestohalophilus]MEA1050602.1 hypothetical protein [Lamprobacter modestohalophilus]